MAIRLNLSKQRCFVWFLAVFTAIGGFLFGYDIGVINGVKDTDGFRHQFNLTKLKDNVEPPDNEKILLGFLVSVLPLGCFVGSFIGSFFSELFGRKYSIVIGAGLFVIGGILQAASVHIGVMYAGRILSGFSVGILSMVVPVFNAEVSPKEIRGKLVSLYQLAITAGIMISFIMTYALQPHDNLQSHDDDFGWRISLGLQCLFGIVFGVGMLFLPETPRWLVKKGKVEKAKKVLVKIRPVRLAEEELEDIVKDIESNPSLGWRETFVILFSKRVFVRVIIGVLLQLFQQFTGINVIMYFSTTIFAKVQVPRFESTAIVGVTNFLSTFLAILLIDKAGRKLLLLLGGAGMSIVVLLAGILAAIRDDIAMATTSTLIASNQSSSNETASVTPTAAEYALGYLIVAMVMLFVFNFAYSWGPIVWVINSEIFPLNIRGVAVSITTAANWIGNFALASMTPLMVDSRWGTIPGTSGTFFLLSGFLALGFLFVFLVLPETKGKSLEAIDDTFKQPWIHRVGLLSYCRCCPKNCLEKLNRESSDSYDLTQKSETSAEDTVPLVSENDDNVSTELEN